MSYGIGSAIASAANAQAIIDTIGNMNEWQAYARKLEDRIAKQTELQKETNKLQWESLMCSMMRKAINSSYILWSEKYGKLPTHPHLKSIANDDEEYARDCLLKVAVQLFRAHIAFYAHANNSDYIYEMFDDYGRKEAVRVAMLDLEMEEWQIIRAINHTPMSNNDYKLITQDKSEEDKKSVLACMKNLTF